MNDLSRTASLLREAREELQDSNDRAEMKVTVLTGSVGEALAMLAGFPNSAAMSEESRRFREWQDTLPRFMEESRLAKERRDAETMRRDREAYETTMKREAGK